MSVKCSRCKREYLTLYDFVFTEEGDQLCPDCINSSASALLICESCKMPRDHHTEYMKSSDRVCIYCPTRKD